MNKLTKKEKARSLEQVLERQKKMWIARGEIKVLDKLWLEVDWRTKEKVINGINKNSDWSDDEEWKGLTLTEKFTIIQHIISKEND